MPKRVKTSTALDHEYMSVRAYHEASGLSEARIRAMCRSGELECTGNGEKFSQFKVKVYKYDPKMYEKLMAENERYKQIIKNIGNIVNIELIS